MNNEALNEMKQTEKSKGRPKLSEKEPRKSMNVSLKASEGEKLLQAIQAIGLGTMGDLVQIMVKHPEVLAHFKPYVKEQMKYLEKTPISSETALEKRLRVLKQLDPEKYKKILGSIEE